MWRREEGRGGRREEGGAGGGGGRKIDWTFYNCKISNTSRQFTNNVNAEERDIREGTER